MSVPSDPVYRVVVNDEEQYSIWPAGQPIPAGWQDEGMSGAEDACIAHIEEVWVDMRPRSLRTGPAEDRP
jgi:MbtH protein